ncbi:hypothetical protein ACCT11_36755, partial [Rhizobium johnstonii]|uniref:hypothetical protein n=1 Tax=Rhizobium johnstonii TaxID=3019933 RepID=UPI003F97E1FE
RALYVNPKFVVHDETNSNIEKQGEAALAKELIHDKKQGITTVTITQHLEPFHEQGDSAVLYHKDLVDAIEESRALG